MVSRETKRILEKRNQEIYDTWEGKGLTIRQLANKYELGRATIWTILQRVPKERLQSKRLAVVEALIFSGKTVGIEELDLPVRLALALEMAGIIRTDDLFLKGKRDFLHMKQIGPRSVKVLESIFIKYGKWSQRNWL